MTVLALSMLPTSTGNQPSSWPEPGTGLGSEIREVPARLWPVVEQLVQLATLPPGWNSYNGRAVTPAAIRAALQLLVELGWGGPLPTVSPTAPGGVQLEWGSDDYGVELEIRPNATIAVLVRADEFTEWESEITGAADGRLQEALIWAEKLA